MEGDWPLVRLLVGLEEVVQQRLAQSNTVVDFVEELVQLLQPLVQQVGGSPFSFYYFFFQFFFNVKMYFFTPPPMRTV